MKPYKIIFIALLFLTACDDTIKKEPATEHVPVLSAGDNIYGFWISDVYIEKLKSTRSPRLSQEATPLSMLNFFSNNGKNEAMAIYNFHEGSEPYPFTLEEDNSGSVGKTKVEFSFQIADNKLAVKEGNKETQFVKFAGAGEDADPSIIINEVLFQGKYSDGKNKIEFTKGGKILEHKELKKYRINVDYIDAGMQYDLIFLTFQGSEREVKCGFEFKGDTLEIFELGCKEMDEEYEICYEHTREKTLFRFTKIDR